VPAISSYDYAVIRVVPCVERGECMNVGIILFCRTRRFLKALVEVDKARLAAFAPQIDAETLWKQLNYLEIVSTGKQASGPIGQLSQSERFHWIVSPRNTVIQTSPVHSGLCEDPEKALHKLLQKMVI
jgi:hypothetical protein